MFIPFPVTFFPRKKKRSNPSFQLNLYRQDLHYKAFRETSIVDTAHKMESKHDSVRKAREAHLINKPKHYIRLA